MDQNTERIIGIELTFDYIYDQITKNISILVIYTKTQYLC